MAEGWLWWKPGRLAKCKLSCTGPSRSVGVIHCHGHMVMVVVVVANPTQNPSWPNTVVLSWYEVLYNTSENSDYVL